MDIARVTKESFTVIGKEGSTEMGEGFIQKLWLDANSHFDEVAPLAKKNEMGALVGIWGAMSDMSKSFMPWENGFSKGLYLAGVECEDTAEAPAGWTKWVIPAYEFLKVHCDGSDVFHKTLEYMEKEGLTLMGAVHDFTDPQTGENGMFFPIEKL